MPKLRPRVLLCTLGELEMFGVTLGGIRFFYNILNSLWEELTRFAAFIALERRQKSHFGRNLCVLQYSQFTLGGIIAFQSSYRIGKVPRASLVHIGRTWDIWCTLGGIELQMDESAQRTDPPTLTPCQWACFSPKSKGCLEKGEGTPVVDARSDKSQDGKRRNE